MTATPLRSIQPANSPDGTYDVRKPLPYPYHVEPDGTIARQDFWRGEPARLHGFQREAHVHRVDVLAETWLADPDMSAAGLFPVFGDADGGMWVDTRPIMGDAS